MGVLSVKNDNVSVVVLFLNLSDKFCLVMVDFFCSVLWFCVVFFLLEVGVKIRCYLGV